MIFYRYVRIILKQVEIIMKKEEGQQELLQKIGDNERIIFKICHTYCINKADREDLAQEIIYQLLRSYHSYSGQFKFSTWMYRVSLNVAISFYRKKSAKKEIYYQQRAHDLKEEINADKELEENLIILEKYINELKELDKALMVLYLESKSYQEIAEILGITETNVATKVSRIKEILKRKFSAINT